jgi:hypothetical protein
MKSAKVCGKEPLITATGGLEAERRGEMGFAEETCWAYAQKPCFAI